MFWRCWTYPWTLFAIILTISDLFVTFFIFFSDFIMGIEKMIFFVVIIVHIFLVTTLDALRMSGTHIEQAAAKVGFFIFAF